MDTNKIKRNLKSVLDDQRYEHTLRVTEQAIQLATRYSSEINKVEVAALLHDYAKCMNESILKSYIERFKLCNNLLDYNKELWHGPVGAELVRRKFAIEDESILNAIRYHTTGRQNMTDIEMIVFLADYTEPARQFPGVNEVRDLLNNDLYHALRKALVNTINFLMNRNVLIHPDTFLAYNDVTKKIGVKYD